MTYEKALAYGKKVLHDAGITDCGLDAWYLMEYVFKIEKSWYYLHNTQSIQEEKFEEYQRLLKKRGERIPLQYITGHQEFMGLDFKVNSHVLIPRQDTETLVEEALKRLEPSMEVLDLCTGSGCVIISMGKHREIVATASDVSKQALLLAKENAKAHQVELNLVRSDLFHNITGTFDMIVANPPYIPTEVIGTLMPEVREFEPIEALDGREDGMYFHREIIQGARKFLNSNGYLCLEIGYDQGGKVAFLMEENGYRNVKVVKDLAGNNRVVCGNLPAVK
ncbi:MAG: peptide chain release factor N(5)-glutamine methyltransferase [Lachnospiraceae bacterium]|jgi:release factor glutamine methyltransferase|nr:peptide chain release factor N(5)-glutamine methyltransferase [Lachnospiraceae bacterium]